MSHFVKLYGSILDSSVWGESKDTRLVWVTLLAMADPEGYVEASLPGLARRANVTIEECEAALAVLSAPDPYSKSQEHDGRRVEKVARGWLVLNYEAYREMRTRSQADAARRKREQRERERGHGGVTECDSHAESHEDVTVTPVTDASTSTSTSPSSSASQKKELENSVGKEGHVALAEFMAKRDFGRFAQIVQGYIASQRSAVAVMATFEMHLTGEMEHEHATPEQLGLAVQQYSANEGSQRFSARYFAGFVRDVKKQVERGGRRKANASEQQHIDREADEARQRERETRQGKLIAYAETEHPERLAELRRIADSQVPKKFSADVRENMVHGALIDLIRKEWPDAR